MAIIHQRITIINQRQPRDTNVNDKLQWLGSSLGLFNLRDKDKSCFRIFIELIKASKIDRELSSDELAFMLNLSRGTIVHHLNKLIEAGLVSAKNQRYILRVHNLKDLIDHVEKDFLRTFQELREVADDVDKRLGLLPNSRSNVVE